MSLLPASQSCIYSTPDPARTQQIGEVDHLYHAKHLKNLGDLTSGQFLLIQRGLLSILFLDEAHRTIGGLVKRAAGMSAPENPPL